MGVYETTERNQHAARVGRQDSEAAKSGGKMLTNVSRRPWILIAAAALALFISLWAMLILFAGGGGFGMAVPGKLQGGEEAASSVARLFAALVLSLFVAEREGRRMRWVAAGILVLGLGHLIFGYIEPALQNDPIELNESLYEVFVTQTLACALFAIGLFPGTPHRFLVRTVAAIPVMLVAGYVVVFEFMGGDEWMPLLALVDRPEETVKLGSPLDWLTPLHWTISLLPLGLAVAALLGAFWHSRRGLLRGWVLFATVLLAGSILHEYLWPSAYGGNIVTTADALSLSFAASVAVGGILELRRAASQRAALLAAERERTQRLSDLAALRADFSAMVAHELDSPLSAVRRLTEMLGVEELNEGARSSVLSMIDCEIGNLNTLVADVRTAAMVERDDFEIEPQPLPLDTLLEESRVYTSTLYGKHPLGISFESGLDGQTQTMADPNRIGQVLRNLFSNAAKYSPEGTRIELRVKRSGERLRIEVADQGPGIHPDDVSRIFEKFGRGRDKEGRKVAGVGLGLYLSRRIIRAHGGELTVDTKLGEGSVFGFDLELAQ